MTLSTLSPKQEMILKWAFMPSTKDKYKAIICAGAVRSGKTVCMLVAFILWAMRNYNGQNFGICGKTVASAERNIVRPALDQADLAACYTLFYRRADHMLIVRGQNRENRFYIFGGERREQLHADSGNYPVRCAVRRGGADAPILCGTGHCPDTQ